MARTSGSDGEKTEAAIREAAVLLIARHGFEAVSMRQLAAEVGVQAAALYRYFPNKEELLSMVTSKVRSKAEPSYKIVSCGNHCSVLERSRCIWVSSRAEPLLAQYAFSQACVVATTLVFSAKRKSHDS